MLLGQMAVLSGVPSYVFGSQVSRRASESERILLRHRPRDQRLPR